MRVDRRRFGIGDDRRERTVDVEKERRALGLGDERLDLSEVGGDAS
jgi:hypothetical protein